MTYMASVRKGGTLNDKYERRLGRMAKAEFWTGSERGSELLVKREGKASVLRQAGLCLVCSQNKGMVF